jgi:hypothetical protein
MIRSRSWLFQAAVHSRAKAAMDSEVIRSSPEFWVLSPFRADKADKVVR